MEDREMSTYARRKANKLLTGDPGKCNELFLCLRNDVAAAIDDAIDEAKREARKEDYREMEGLRNDIHNLEEVDKARRGKLDSAVKWGNELAIRLKSLVNYVDSSRNCNIKPIREAWMLLDSWDRGEKIPFLKTREAEDEQWEAEMREEETIETFKHKQIMGEIQHEWESDRKLHMERYAVTWGDRSSQISALVMYLIKRGVL